MIRSDLFEDNQHGSGHHLTHLNAPDSDHPRLAIGVPDSNLNEVYLLEGPFSGEHHTAHDAIGHFTSDERGDSFGRLVIAAGDLTSDGRDDLLITAPMGGEPEEAGAAYIFAGPLTGSHTLAETTAAVYGSQQHDTVGFAAVAGKDVTGDGLALSLIHI